MWNGVVWICTLQCYWGAETMCRGWFLRSDGHLGWAFFGTLNLEAKCPALPTSIAYQHCGSSRSSKCWTSCVRPGIRASCGCNRWDTNQLNTKTDSQCMSVLCLEELAQNSQGYPRGSWSCCSMFYHRSHARLSTNQATKKRTGEHSNRTIRVVLGMFTRGTGYFDPCQDGLIDLRISEGPFRGLRSSSFHRFDCRWGWSPKLSPAAWPSPRLDQIPKLWDPQWLNRALGMWKKMMPSLHNALNMVNDVMTRNLTAIQSKTWPLQTAWF